MMPYRLALPLLFLVLLPIPATAQDMPLLVLRLLAAGLETADKKTGLSGAVYTLRGEDSSLGPALTVQVAFDGQGRGVLTRLSLPLAEAEDGDLLRRTAETVLPLIQPGATGLTLEFLSPADLNKTPRPVPIDGGSPAQLSFADGAGAGLSGTAIAVLDIPVSAPREVRLTEAALRDLLSDATLRQGPGARYHAPDGRYGGDGGTGSWKVTANGHYCIEAAPEPGFRCAAIYRTGDRAYLSVPIANGRPDPSAIRAFSVDFGNPEGFVTPRRADATPKAVTDMILGRNTEERRGPSGEMADRLYLDPDGSFRGVRAGVPISGRWTILEDGRRCLINTAGRSECVFLSETDGGTFRHFDADGNYRGEALYRDGNPNGF